MANPGFNLVVLSILFFITVLVISGAYGEGVGMNDDIMSAGIRCTDLVSAGERVQCSVWIRILKDSIADVRLGMYIMQPPYTSGDVIHTVFLEHIVPSGNYKQGYILNRTVEITIPSNTSYPPYTKVFGTLKNYGASPIRVWAPFALSEIRFLTDRQELDNQISQLARIKNLLENERLVLLGKLSEQGAETEELLRELESTRILLAVVGVVLGLSLAGLVTVSRKKKQTRGP